MCSASLETWADNVIRVLEREQVGMKWRRMVQCGQQSFVVGVGKVGTSRRDPEGVGTAGGELARDERVGGDDELMVVGNEVVGGHEECKADGCPKR